MVEGIPTSWLAVLPESLVNSITAFCPVQQGRAQTCFLTLNNEVEVFAKQNESELIQAEINALTFLAQVEPSAQIEKPSAQIEKPSAEIKKPSAQIEKPSAQTKKPLVKTKETSLFSYPKIFHCGSDYLLTVKEKGTPIVDSLEIAIKKRGLAKALVQMHKTEPTHFIDPCPNFEFPSASSLVNALEKFDVDRDSVDKLQRNLKNAVTKLKKVAKYSGFTHGDLTPDNILFDEGKPVFLDWEFASVRDVRWDLATICEEFNLSPKQINQLVNGYLELMPEFDLDFTLGLECWRFIYLVTCFIWSVEQAYKSAEYLHKLINSIDTN